MIHFRNEKREMQEMQDELEDLRDCGLGNCKPAFLQSCANIKVPILYNTYTQLFIFNAKMAFSSLNDSFSKEEARGGTEDALVPLGHPLARRWIKKTCLLLFQLESFESYDHPTIFNLT